jgi:hypothetical protein
MCNPNVFEKEQSAGKLLFYVKVCESLLCLLCLLCLLILLPLPAALLLLILAVKGAIATMAMLDYPVSRIEVH